METGLFTILVPGTVAFWLPPVLLERGAMVPPFGHCPIMQCAGALVHYETADLSNHVIA